MGLEKVIILAYKMLLHPEKAVHSKEILSVLSFQLYNNFSDYLKYLPGSHRKLLKNVSEVKDYALERTKDHQKSLEPSCPRGFLDTMLIEMAKVHSQFAASGPGGAERLAVMRQACRAGGAFFRFM